MREYNDQTVNCRDGTQWDLLNREWISKVLDLALCHKDQSKAIFNHQVAGALHDNFEYCICIVYISKPAANMKVTKGDRSTRKDPKVSFRSANQEGKGKTTRKCLSRFPLKMRRSRTKIQQDQQEWRQALIENKFRYALNLRDPTRKFSLALLGIISSDWIYGKHQDQKNHEMVSPRSEHACKDLIPISFPIWTLSRWVRIKAFGTLLKM